jgi:RHS repeat-associated protein
MERTRKLPNMARFFVGMIAVLATMVPSTNDAFAQSDKIPGMSLGSFKVSNNGAANYTIPIVVPPGINGVAPKLSLQYDSQKPNGLLGIGWTLEGLPTIERCARTKAQDGVKGGVNLDSNDRFCLDRQRLMVINGSGYGANGAEYRTEMDSFVRVFSYGQVPSPGSGPLYFVVKNKSGETMYFGGDDSTTPANRIADGRIEAEGKTNIRVWALSKIQDTNGNFIKIVYEGEKTNGDYRPHQIDYTANGTNQPKRSIVFTYGSRSDLTPTYVGGSLVKVMQVLTHIKTYAPSDQNSGSLLVRNYVLQYENGTATGRSRLKTITECSVDSCQAAPNFTCLNDGSCLPPTSLTWSEGSDGHFVFTPGQNVGFGFGDMRVGDFNGDGKFDLVRANGGQYVTAFSNGDGSYTVSNPFPPNNNWGPNNQTWAGDANGNGRTDLISHDKGSNKIASAFSNGDGTWFEPTPVVHPSGWSINNTTWVGDFNGDGRIDLINFTGSTFIVALNNGDGTFTPCQIPVPINNWHATRTWVGDFNGDGISDLVTNNNNGQFVFAFFNDNCTIQSPPGIPLPSEWSYNATNPNVWVGDFNGDGKADLLNHANNKLVFIFSKGDGTVSTSAVANEPAAGFDNPGVWIGDFNGDGKSDAVSFKNNNFIPVFSNGDGNVRVGVLSPASNWANTRTTVADINGDGLTDLIQINNNNVFTGFASGVYPDLLTSISTNLAGKIDVIYKPITDNSVYTKDNDAVYPVMDLQGPIYVVDTFTTNTKKDGSGSSFSYTHDYGGAKYHHFGRGGLGFRWMRTVDQAANVNPSNPLSKSQNTSYFHQIDPQTHLVDFPRIGLLSFSETVDTQDPTHPFAQISNTYTPTTTVHPTVSFPALRLVVKSQCDGLEGCLHAATKFEYDTFGNRTRVFNLGEVTSAEISSGNFVLSGDERDEVTDFVSDTAQDHWIHRPDHVQLLDPNSPPPNNVVREKWLYYDDLPFASTPAKGLLTKEENRTYPVGDPRGNRDSGSNSTVTHHYDPVFGNEDLTTDPIGCRTKTTAFDFTNTFPVTVVRCFDDPIPHLIHTMTFTFDPRFGVKTSEKGPCVCPNPIDPVTTSTFDSFGRLVRINGPMDKDPAPPTEVRDYLNWGDPVNQRIKITKIQNHGQASPTIIREEFFDGLGRFNRIQYDGPGGTTIREDSDFDSRDLLVSKVAPRFFPTETALPATSYVYDVLGRQVLLTHPDGRHADTVYDPGVITIFDENGHEKIRFLDAYDQVVEIDEINHVNASEEIYKTLYDYDVAGSLIQVTQKGKNNEFNLVTTLAYDPLGRKTELIDPNMGRWTYAYDNAGNLLTQIDPNLRNLSTQLSFEFDSRSRMNKKTYPNGTHVDFTYDQDLNSVGRLSHVGDLNGMATSLSYDLKGRVVQTDRVIDGTTHTMTQTYNALDQVTNETFLDDNDSVNYAYDKGFLTRIFDTFAPDYVSNISYNARLQKTSIQHGNVTTNIGYFDQNILNQKINFLPQSRVTGSLQNLSYLYDNVGNITDILDNTLVNPTAGRTFAYDDLNRLISASGRFGPLEPPNTGLPTQVTDQQHTYDAVGNLLTKGSVTYQYCNHPNPANTAPLSLCSDPSIHPSAVVRTFDSSTSVEKTYHYDDNGNTKDGAGRVFTWTADNRVATVTKGSLSSMDYDYTGIRLKKTSGSAVTRYPFSDFEIGPDQVIIKRFKAGREIVAGKKGTQKLSYHDDHLGGINVVTDTTTGAKLEVTEYDPWGNVSRNEPNNDSIEPSRRFTGKELDHETDLYYYDARYYDAELPRYISPDPVVPSAEDPQSLNRYSYVKNNPVALIDPTGNEGELFEPAPMLLIPPLLWPRFWITHDDIRRAINAANNKTNEPVVARDVGVDQDKNCPQLCAQIRAWNPPSTGSETLDRWRFKLNDFFARNWARIQELRDQGAQLDLSGAGFAAETTTSAKAYLSKVQSGEIADRFGTKPAFAANVARGLEAEDRVLKELGLLKNKKVVTGAEGSSIPDALTATQSIEIKDRARVDLTRQLRIQIDAAQQSGRDSVLITGRNTCVSGTCLQAFDRVIRRSDLGPR